jgi:hypothetical protein
MADADVERAALCVNVLADIPSELTNAADRSGSVAAQRHTSRFRDTSWPQARTVRSSLGPASGPGAADGSAQDEPPLRPGDKVTHPTFGRGTVISSTGVGADEQVVVAFDGAGVKKLVRGYARLRRS